MTTKEYHRNLASKGGLARAASLTPERRTQIASKAAKAGWKKRKGDTRAGNAANRRKHRRAK